MTTPNRDLGYSAHRHCPRCLEKGIATESGYVPFLEFFPTLEPPYHCAIHGAISVQEMASSGIATTRPPEVPIHQDPVESENPE